MTPRMIQAVVGGLVALLILVPFLMRGEGAEPSDPFAREVDLGLLGEVAVQRDGRVKTLDSHAREMMTFVMGTRRYDAQEPLYSYFDLMYRPGDYEDADIIFVKSKLVRSEIARELRLSRDEQLAGSSADPRVAEAAAMIDERIARFMETGLISEPMLLDPRVRTLLGRLEGDVLRTAKYVQAIDSALTVRQPSFLAGGLKTVPPPGDDLTAPWMTLNDLAQVNASGAASGVAPELQSDIVRAWSDLRSAWRSRDAAAATAAANQLGTLLPQVNPGLYPDAKRLAWERWYFGMGNMTWVWVLYALALIPLILHVVFRWEGARWFGFAMFCAAFILHTFAVMLRWYVAERWPNSNMFEAITTAAWFGGCLAVLLELGLNKYPVRGIIAVGSATASMVALMAADFLPLQLNPAIGNMMPVLHDVWLYVHTNVIIFSYCLIFMAAISAGLYLGHRGLLRLRGEGGGAKEYARVGGAASLIMTAPGGGTYLGRAKTSFGQVLDGTTMILIELSFILLWAGLVMGAIWADHSWGRPWGWDPKEVFALNTFIIFALLIHTRMKVKDKGLWTAVLAVIGCVVMLFNWVVINFTIAGLHSYA